MSLRRPGASRAPRPPRFARALIARLTPEEDRRYVLEDMAETFERMAGERGVGAAKRWYRGQLVRSLPLAAALVVSWVGAWRNADLRSAFRLLHRRPLYAFGVAGTLGLGLVSAVVLGGIAWRVWLRPLPFSDSEKLVRVYELGRPDPAGERDRGRISPPLLRDLREAEWAHFTDFGAISMTTPEWMVEGEVRPLRGSAVTPGFFELLDVAPTQGRLAWSSRNGAEVPEVILSEAFWRQSFGADPAVVGATIDLGGTLHTVIGVIRQEGGYPAPVDLFTPLVFEERRLGEGMRGARYLESIARVRPESSIEAASEELAGFVASLGADHPIHEGWIGEAVSLRSDLTGPFRDVFRLLIAAGMAFLLLALVNVVGLASTRALDRKHELGIRLALGASTGRLARGAWTEGAVLGGLGGAAALAGALLLLPATAGWLPADLARSSEVGLSWSGGVGWWALALLAGGLVGVLGHRMAPGGARTVGGTRWTASRRGGAALVAGQLALTTLLVGVGSLVFERSLRLADHDYGFESEGVYSAFVGLPRSTHEDWEARRDAWGALVAALQDAGVPAAVTTNPPMSGMTANYGYARPGAEHETFGQYSIVTPEYFDIMGIPILAGRTFEAGESGPVTVISEGLAREQFEGENPVGQELMILGQAHDIVGVVGSTAHFGPDTPPPTALYVSYESVSWDFAHVVARGGPHVGPAIAQAVALVAPGAVEPNVAPYETHLSNWFRPLRIQLGIVGALALIGALLAGLGLYANIAYQVRGQLPELGIRVALGASRVRILSGVVRRGLVSAGAGLVVGLLAWWLGRRALREVLGATDAVVSPFALGITAALILTLALLAVSLPALRASRADPLESLKAE